MTINSQTHISTILRKSPHSLYANVKLSPKFVKLINPILRKVMAPRVSIAQAARIGGCTPQYLFEALKPLGFEIEEKAALNTYEPSKTEKPSWIIHAGADQIKVLDVRPILEQKKDPLNHILNAIKMLQSNEILCIINSFEPTPLIKLLLKKGYAFHVEKMHEEKVFTYFRLENNDDNYEKKESDRQEKNFDEILLKYNDRLKEIDVRKLQMPQPMLTILKKITHLPKDFALYVNHKRLPLYLLPELHERGFNYAVKEIEEGNVKLLIYRK